MNEGTLHPTFNFSLRRLGQNIAFFFSQNERLFGKNNLFPTVRNPAVHFCSPRGKKTNNWRSGWGFYRFTWSSSAHTNIDVSAASVVCRDKNSSEEMDCSFSSSCEPRRFTPQRTNTLNPQPKETVTETTLHSHDKLFIFYYVLTYFTKKMHQKAAFLFKDWFPE